MGPHTITGWISFAAVMTGGFVTGATGMKLGSDLHKGRRGDRRDILAAYTFGTLTMLAAMLFVFAEGQP
ncbi:hypothetical protein GOFOIKOB_6568 [Methylobacterium tardum]|uniref:Uncharacterized protein n=1 Tax=Methylobacterium tardum TaxID=374432 RepID=A0AA37TIL4_9HYPH|nr:hypothetical protein GOFOIKOB_6568 [Methylobacterium tardum]GLS74624.1 hypothetical protein GCM10007890_66420 [Methylobacterium tardum]